MKLIRQRDVPDMLQARLPADLHPVLRRIYAGRQIRTAEELDNGLARLLPPAALKDIECAVGLLETALCGGQRILVVRRGVNRRPQIVANAGCDESARQDPAAFNRQCDQVRALLGATR